jgi:hypothetical protein
MNAGTLLVPSCVAAVALGACGGGGKTTSAESSPPGDIPDNEVSVRYRPPGADYRDL